MFDITEPTTFNNLEGWYRDADRCQGSSAGSKLDYVLVGMKSDMKSDRKVTVETAKVMQ